MSCSLRPALRPWLRCCPTCAHIRNPRFRPYPLTALALLFTLCFAIPAHAAKDKGAPTSEAIAQLEQRASQADPREQCFLYTELVHDMTEQAGKQIGDGESEQAAATLNKINRYAHLIHVNLAHDTKRLKDAEVMMHNTTFKLAQFLHLVSGPDKDTVQATLTQLDQVNDELLTQVFAH
jgi:hypothetical protein